MSGLKKYGTFAGVFTPSILTILGVIMYMRMGAVVGNSSSIWMTIGIILFAHVISVTTGLSVSSVATDKKIKAGGIYYMLSRSLGFPIGGAIGVSLFVATALSISLYLIGFGESVLNFVGVEEITTNHLRLAGGGALLLVVFLAIISTSLAMKAQFFILGFIAISLLSIFFGDAEGIEKGTDIIQNPNFALLFGIFFPAVTGFTAGVAMSGDLKNPIKSIPWGTMLAIAVGLIVYLGLALFMNFSIDKDVLATNNNAIVEFAAVGFLVVLGIWGATLSSALGGILGAPRILQAMSNDKITPAIFGKGVGENNEPRNALILTGVIALAGIMIGELNAIAEIVAMLYMTAYLFINVTCVLEQWASPDFRPSFRIPLMVPLVGAIATGVLMIQLNLGAAIVAVLVVVGLFFWLAKKQLEVGSGDVWNSVWSSIVKIGLKNLQKKSTHKRNWEPNILLFSGDSNRRNELISFSKSIAGQNGMISNFDLILNDSAKVLFPKHQQTGVVTDQEDDAIFYRQQECQNIYRGIENIANTYGFSGIDPNTVLMGWGRNTENPAEFAKMTDYLTQLDHNVLFLDYDEQKGFGAQKTLDIWWTHLEEYCDLSLHLSKLLLSSSAWSQIQIRILFNNLDNSTHDYIERIIASKCENNRILAEIVVVNNELEKKSLYELVRKYSADTDLIFLELPQFKNHTEATFVSTTNDLLHEIGTTLIFRASTHFYEDINLDPALQKEYQEMKSKIEFDKRNVDFMAKPSQFSEVNAVLEDLGAKMYDEHHEFAKGVYQSLDEVYAGFVKVVSDLILKEGTDTQIRVAVEDFKNERLVRVKNAMHTGLKSLLLNSQDFVGQLPSSIDLVYSEESLQINQSDSKEVQKFKKRIKQKKGKQKFNLFNSLSYHLEEHYLQDFRRMLRIQGLSGFMLNTTLIQEIKKGVYDPETLQEKLAATITKEHQIFLQYSKGYIQKFLQFIIDDAENVAIEKIAINREEEKDGARLKRYLLNLGKYPSSFLRNQQLLTNQLECLFYLEKLKMNFLGVLEVESQTLGEELGNEVVSLKESAKEYLGLDKEAYLKLSPNISSKAAIKTFISRVNLELGEVLLPLREDVEIITPKSINDFEKTQDNVAVSNVSFKKTVSYGLESDFSIPFVQKFNEWHYELMNLVEEVNKSLKLLSYQYANVSSSGDDIQKVKDMLSSKIDQLQIGYNKVINGISNRKEVFVEKLTGVLDVEVLLNKSSFSQSVYFKNKAYSSGAKYLRKTKMGLRFIDKKLDDIIIKLRDTVSRSSFEYRTKSLLNLQSRLGDFVANVSMSPDVSGQVPYYYQQLFNGKQMAPDKELEHRGRELKEAGFALNKWKNGSSGIILFTGELLSGKSFVKQNFINSKIKGEVYKIEKQNPESVENFETLLQKATGIYLPVDELLGSLKDGVVIDISDLEYHWHRSEGTAELADLLKLIKKHYHRLLFLVDCNIHFYNHAKFIYHLDDIILSSIVVRPLDTKAVKEIILDRHHAGGLKFFWQNKHEDDTKLRRVNRLFTKLNLNADGNIGCALHLWLGGIEKIENNVVILDKMDFQSLSFKLKSEWELLLYQIIMCKTISVEKLIGVFGDEVFDVEVEVENLLRSNVVSKTITGEIRVNPYASVFVLKYLRKQQIIL